MEFRSWRLRVGIATICAATATAFAVVSGPAANADSVEPYTSQYGNIEIYTLYGGDGTVIAWKVSNFRLAGDNSRPEMSNCIIGARNEATNQSSVGKLAVTSGGDGTGYVGPLPNGTYSTQLNCGSPRASGGPLNQLRGDPSNPLIKEITTYADAKSSGQAIVHIDGSPMSQQLWLDLPPAPEFNPGPLAESPYSGGPNVNDIEANSRKGDSCADALGDFSKLPPGTESALEQLKQIPKNASNYAYAACALETLVNSPNPGNDQDVFNSICKGLENALDPLGVGAAKDFFCGTTVS